MKDRSLTPNQAKEAADAADRLSKMIADFAAIRAEYEQRG
jgi:hypothetical protein